MRKTRTLAGFFFVLLAATGCSSSGAPDCSDSATTDLVIEIASEEIATSFATYKGWLKQMAHSMGGELDEDIESVDYLVDAIRVADKNEKTGSYSCKANLVSKANGTSSEVPIEYTSELADGGENFYVEVFGLHEEAQGSLLAVLIR